MKNNARSQLEPAHAPGADSSERRTLDPADNELICGAGDAPREDRQGLYFAPRRLRTIASLRRRMSSRLLRACGLLVTTPTSLLYGSKLRSDGSPHAPCCRTDRGSTRTRKVSAHASAESDSAGA